MMERIDSDDGKLRLTIEPNNSKMDLDGLGDKLTSEVSGICEIDFIESVRSIARILYTREKKENILPIYDWKLFRKDMESKDTNLTPFFNMLEKLINPSGRGLLDQQRQ